MFVYEMTQMQVFRAINVARTRSKLRPTMRISRIKKKWITKIVESGRMPFATQRPKDQYTGEKADRINIGHIFFPIVEGGDIMHISLGEGYPDPGGIKSFALFFTISPLISAHKQAL